MLHVVTARTLTLPLGILRIPAPITERVPMLRAAESRSRDGAMVRVDTALREAARPPHLGENGLEIDRAPRIRPFCSSGREMTAGVMGLS
jgi:hypothetical protein